MTKAQATAMLNAMEQNSLPGTLTLSFNGAGVPQYAVGFDPTHIYSGTDVQKITQYAKDNGLTLSVQIDQMGVV